MKLFFSVKKKKRGKNLGLLRGKMLKEVRWDLEPSNEETWNAMVDIIRKISQEVFEELKGRGPTSKETWW